MIIRYAELSDLEMVAGYDHHVAKEELTSLIGLKRLIVMLEENHFVGWLRYNLFWDNTPFMNMLYLLKEYRGQGYGGRLSEFWEVEMKKRGYDTVLTSSLANEQAQLFYRKRGYVDCGALLLPGEPLEILFMKKL